MAPRATWLSILPLSLLPSFVADALRTDHKAHKPARLHPTSYLDGLRGIAALVVFICHYTEDHYEYFTPSYGLNGSDGPSALIQLPFVRIIYSGRPMVHIFFVISGFALSYKPLKAIHAHDIEKCHALLASSAFRRPFRLFAPCIVSTFLIMLLIQAGLLYEPLPTFSGQVYDWAFALFHSITWPWAWDYDLRPPYDIHLWTIPIEFVHSMLLFTVILTLSPVRRPIRLLIVFGLMVYCLACGRWAGFEFLGGSLIAEVQLIKTNAHASMVKPQETLQRKRHAAMSFIRVMCYVTLILSAWFVGGWPNEDAERTPGISYLLANTPYPYNRMDALAPQKMWFAISAMLIVWSFSQLPSMRRLLESSVSQYFGRISYAVYIVHGPVMNLCCERLVGSSHIAAVGKPDALGFKPEVVASGIKGLVGVEGPLQRMLAWLLGLFMLAPAVIWIADVFWRFVDIPIIATAKRLEKWCVER
jgi:peptidoglycan/LPS O-acetylase OafA/YrhL